MKYVEINNAEMQCLPLLRTNADSRGEITEGD